MRRCRTLANPWPVSPASPLLFADLANQSMAELKLASMPSTLSMQMHSMPKEPQSNLRPQNRNLTQSSDLDSIEPGCSLAVAREFCLNFLKIFAHYSKRIICLSVSLSCSRPRSLSAIDEFLPRNFNKTSEDGHKEQNVVKTTAKESKAINGKE